MDMCRERRTPEERSLKKKKKKKKKKDTGEDKTGTRSRNGGTEDETRLDGVLWDRKRTLCHQNRTEQNRREVSRTGAHFPKYLKSNLILKFMLHRHLHLLTAFQKVAATLKMSSPENEKSGP